jgi:hypothetical protein
MPTLSSAPTAPVLNVSDADRERLYVCVHLL